jgi:hypothetical protein
MPVRAFLRSFLAMLVVALPAAAHAGGAQIAVSAVVAKSSRISFVGQPASIEVTESDVARGYVELPAGARLELWSNSREGIVLSFSSSEPFAWSTSLVMPGGTQRVDLRYRLPLAPATQPGSYPWPVRITATPL